MKNLPYPLFSCENDGLSTTFSTVLLVAVLFFRNVEKRDHAKSFRGKQRAKRNRTRRKGYRRYAHTGYSACNCRWCVVHVYLVLAPDCKQSTGFFALPLRSSDSQHKLYIIESHESTPNDWQSSLIQIKTTLLSELTQTGSKSIRLEPV